MSAKELWCAHILFDIQDTPFLFPLTGKTTTAIALAKYYEAALLTVDSIVLEAISNGNTPSGPRARELCSQAAKAQLIKDGEATADGQTTAGGLSVEAVAAYMQRRLDLVSSVQLLVLTTDVIFRTLPYLSPLVPVSHKTAEGFLSL